MAPDTAAPIELIAFLVPSSVASFIFENKLPIDDRILLVGLEMKLNVFCNHFARVPPPDTCTSPVS